jgi:hypothetical protein
MKNARKFSVGNSEGKRPLARTRYRWDVNVEEIWREVVDWIQLAQGREQWRTFVYTVFELRVP